MKLQPLTTRICTVCGQASTTVSDSINSNGFRFGKPVMKQTTQKISIIDNSNHRGGKIDSLF